MTGNKKAEARVLKLAYEQGAKEGQESSAGVFKIAALVKDFAKDPAIRNAFPSNEFMHWSNTAREAYLKGFYSTFKSSYTRRLRLPLDEPNPPFVDPCSDRSRDHRKVVYGLRKPQDVLDNTYWRGNLAKEFGKIGAKGL